MPLIPKQEPPYYENTNGITVKTYRGLLNQSGTSAPTIIELENTFDGTPTLTRTGPGDYTFILTGELTLNKTFVQISSTVQEYQVIAANGTFTINQFAIYTLFTDGTFFDGNLINTPIKIIVNP